MYGKFEWIKSPGDELKTYPFCCGTKTRKKLAPITTRTTAIATLLATSSTEASKSVSSTSTASPKLTIAEPTTSSPTTSTMQNQQMKTKS